MYKGALRYKLVSAIAPNCETISPDYLYADHTAYFDSPDELIIKYINSASRRRDTITYSYNELLSEAAFKIMCTRISLAQDELNLFHEAAAKVNIDELNKLCKFTAKDGITIL